jgi:hypothetical protein
MDYITDILPAVYAAEDRLEAAGGDMSRLPEPLQVVLLIDGAQGVIDNGGYVYFFEEDWPNIPSYDDFISAYEAIGCEQQAVDLRRVVATFPFENPHLHKEQRQAFMDARYDKSEFCIPEWGNALCGDTDVWEKLARYYEMHEDDF